jgi:hypothetical protein
LALVLTVFAASPAQACRDTHEPNLAQVKSADVVVVGRIANYVTSEITFFEPSGRGLGTRGRYARFDIVVDEVLKGEAPKALSAMWINSVFTLPDSKPPGPYVIALQDAKARLGGSFIPKQTPGLIVLQEACEPPFLFKSESPSAAEIRALLKTSKKGAGSLRRPS